MSRGEIVIRVLIGIGVAAGLWLVVTTVWLLNTP